MLMMFASIYFPKFINRKKLDDNFEKKCRSFDSSSLPPCKSELYQRLFRVRYVTKFWRNAHLKNPSSLSPLSSGWIVNDDKYDFVWFAREQFPSSVADTVIKKPTLLENQNTKQDDDYYDIDNNGSRVTMMTIMKMHWFFVTLLRNENTYFMEK
ncbi:uncharacterized protein TNCV_3965701 [Trichonephila clavipes]|nr:uncharacterized protein TNCV_3965701 [Trichonephila clavipes]